MGHRVPARWRLAQVAQLQQRAQAGEADKRYSGSWRRQRQHKPGTLRQAGASLRPCWKWATVVNPTTPCGSHARQPPLHLLSLLLPSCWAACQPRRDLVPKMGRCPGCGLPLPEDCTGRAVGRAWHTTRMLQLAIVAAVDRPMCAGLSERSKGNSMRGELLQHAMFDFSVHPTALRKGFAHLVVGLCAANALPHQSTWVPAPFPLPTARSLHLLSKWATDTYGRLPSASQRTSKNASRRASQKAHARQRWRAHRRGSSGPK